MDYTEQATQMFVVVILLVAAYFGVMVWTRRTNNRAPGEGGGGGFFGGGGGGSEGFTGSALSDLDDTDVAAPMSKADRNKGRFQLQGRDAEVAARVLKRMLKQDPGFRGGEDEQ